MRLRSLRTGKPGGEAMRPGGSRMTPMRNCALTLLRQGNRAIYMKPGGLDRIADHQGFDRSEWAACFAQVETEESRKATYCEEIEGK